MNVHPAVDEILNHLEDFPEVPISQKDNILFVEPRDENGFKVELIDNSTEFTLYCDGWFDDQFIQYELASKIFVGSLTTASRLLVKEKNQKRYFFALESCRRGIWRSVRLSTFYPKLYSFWKKKKVYYLQNDWIDIEKLKPWLSEQLTGRKLER